MEFIIDEKRCVTDELILSLPDYASGGIIQIARISCVIVGNGSITVTRDVYNEKLYNQFKGQIESKIVDFEAKFRQDMENSGNPLVVNEEENLVDRIERLKDELQVTQEALNAIIMAMPEKEE